MCLNLTSSLTFSPTGFNSARSEPISITKQLNTRGFIFFRFLRDCYAWLSLVLNSLVNERTILTLGFYVQKLNCLTVLSEQPNIQIVKELSFVKRTILLYKESLYNSYENIKKVCHLSPWLKTKGFSDTGYKFIEEETKRESMHEEENTKEKNKVLKLKKKYIGKLR